MNIREKLIELLTGYSIDQPCDVEFVADHLIANGVTIIPKGAIILTKEEIAALNEYNEKHKTGERK